MEGLSGLGLPPWALGVAGMRRLIAFLTYVAGAALMTGGVACAVIGASGCGTSIASPDKSASPSAKAQVPRIVHYKNAEYGFSLDYPSAFLSRVTSGPEIQKAKTQAPGAFPLLLASKNGGGISVFILASHENTGKLRTASKAEYTRKAKRLMTYFVANNPGFRGVRAQAIRLGGLNGYCVVFRSGAYDYASYRLYGRGTVFDIDTSFLTISQTMDVTGDFERLLKVLKSFRSTN